MRIGVNVWVLVVVVVAVMREDGSVRRLGLGWGSCSSLGGRRQPCGERSCTTLLIPSPVAAPAQQTNNTQALRLTKGSSGEYRLRMPTALILSQFAYEKMPVTLPLDVFVDGKQVGELKRAPAVDAAVLCRLGRRVQTYNFSPLPSVVLASFSFPVSPRLPVSALPLLHPTPLNISQSQRQAPF